MPRKKADRLSGEWHQPTNNAPRKCLISNPYLFTGRRVDEETGLQLNRNRFYHQQLGRWINRDPIGYGGGMNLYGYVNARPTYYIDPLGLKTCKITIYAGHNFNIESMILDDYPIPEDSELPGVPPTDCIVGVGCGIGDGDDGSIQDWLEDKFPCNSIIAPHLCNLDDNMEGLKPDHACANLKLAYKKAIAAAGRMCKGKPAAPGRCKKKNPDWEDPGCDKIVIEIKCDDDFTKIGEEGIWEYDGKEWPVQKCPGLCGKKRTIPCKKK
jgi:RHS repeat-associated protein